MGGFTLVQNDQIICTLCATAADDPGDPTVENYIHQINITEEDIKDRSKGDLLSKGLVVIQTGWFIVQCIARKVERNLVTELEIVTVALTVLNLVTYILWWNKPLDVQCPVRIAAKLEKGIGMKEGNSDDVTCTAEGVNVDAAHVTGAAIRQYKQRDSTFRSAGPSHRLEMTLMGWDDQAWKAKRVPTFYAGYLTSKEHHDYVIWLVGLFVVPTLFGAIHCLAWSSHFPSHMEQLLWRISSLVVTCMPALWLVFGLTGDILFALFLHSVTNWMVTTRERIITVGGILYIVARLSLLGLAFMSLRSLPPGAFKSPSWITFIPHV